MPVLDYYGCEKEVESGCSVCGGSGSSGNMAKCITHQGGATLYEGQYYLRGLDNTYQPVLTPVMWDMDGCEGIACSGRFTLESQICTDNSDVEHIQLLILDETGNALHGTVSTQGVCLNNGVSSFGIPCTPSTHPKPDVYIGHPAESQVIFNPSICGWMCPGGSIPLNLPGIGRTCDMPGVPDPVCPAYANEYPPLNVGDLSQTNHPDCKWKCSSGSFDGDTPQRLLDGTYTCNMPDGCSKETYPNPYGPHLVDGVDVDLDLDTCKWKCITGNLAGQTPFEDGRFTCDLTTTEGPSLNICYERAQTPTYSVIRVSDIKNNPPNTYNIQLLFEDSSRELRALSQGFYATTGSIRKPIVGIEIITRNGASLNPPRRIVLDRTSPNLSNQWCPCPIGQKEVSPGSEACENDCPPESTGRDPITGECLCPLGYEFKDERCVPKWITDTFACWASWDKTSVNVTAGYSGIYDVKLTTSKGSTIKSHSAPGPVLHTTADGEITSIQMYLNGDEISDEFNVDGYCPSICPPRTVYYPGYDSVSDQHYGSCVCDEDNGWIPALFTSTSPIDENTPPLLEKDFWNGNVPKCQCDFGMHHDYGNAAPKYGDRCQVTRYNIDACWADDKKSIVRVNPPFSNLLLEDHARMKYFTEARTPSDTIPEFVPDYTCLPFTVPCVSLDTPYFTTDAEIFSFWRSIHEPHRVLPVTFQYKEEVKTITFNLYRSIFRNDPVKMEPPVPLNHPVEIGYCNTVECGDENQIWNPETKECECPPGFFIMPGSGKCYPMTIIPEYCWLTTNGDKIKLYSENGPPGDTLSEVPNRPYIIRFNEDSPSLDNPKYIATRSNQEFTYGEPIKSIQLWWTEEWFTDYYPDYHYDQDPPIIYTDESGRTYMLVGSRYLLTGKPSVLPEEGRCFGPCPPNSEWDGETCVCEEGYEDVDGVCNACPPTYFYDPDLKMCVCDERNGYKPLIEQQPGPDNSINNFSSTPPLIDWPCVCDDGYTAPDVLGSPCVLNKYEMDVCWLHENKQEIQYTLTPFNEDGYGFWGTYAFIANSNDNQKHEWDGWLYSSMSLQFTQAVNSLNAYYYRYTWDNSGSVPIKSGSKLAGVIATTDPVEDWCDTVECTEADQEWVAATKSCECPPTYVKDNNGKCICPPGYRPSHQTSDEDPFCIPEIIDLTACWTQFDKRNVKLTAKPLASAPNRHYIVRFNHNEPSSTDPRYVGSTDMNYPYKDPINSVQVYFTDNYFVEEYHKNIPVGLFYFSGVASEYCNENDACPGDLKPLPNGDCGCPDGRVPGPNFTCICENGYYDNGVACISDTLNPANMPTCWNIPSNRWVCTSGGAIGLEYEVRKDNKVVGMHKGGTTLCINNDSTGQGTWTLHHETQTITLGSSTGGDRCDNNKKRECIGEGPRHFSTNTLVKAENFNCACDYGYAPTVVGTGNNAQTNCNLIPITELQSCKTDLSNEIILTIQSTVVNRIIQTAPKPVSAGGGYYNVPYEACNGLTDCVTFFIGTTTTLRFRTPVTGSITISLSRPERAQNFMPADPPTTFNVGSLLAGTTTPSGIWEWTSSSTGQCV
jgi:hypothetical protein